MRTAFAVTILALVSSTLIGHAGQLSPERLDALDKRGYFTPDFKAATRRLVNAHDAMIQADAEQKSLSQQLPALQKVAVATEAKTAALREEFAKYNHPEENDFDALKNAMKDAGGNPAEQMVLAQAYVWTYPTSQHADEAQRDLQMIQQKFAAERQSATDAEAARVAAHSQLVVRAQARDLNLSEWRELLRGMSQDELVRMLGKPSSQDINYWYYRGGWVNRTAGSPKVGLQINFDASRVLSVDEMPSLP